MPVRCNGSRQILMQYVYACPLLTKNAMTLQKTNSYFRLYWYDLSTDMLVQRNS